MISILTLKEYASCKKETGEIDVELLVDLCSKAMGVNDHPIFINLKVLGYDPSKVIIYIFAIQNEHGEYLGLSSSANIAKRYLEIIYRPDKKMFDEITRMREIGELPRIKILEKVEKPFLRERKVWWSENAQSYLRIEKIDMLLKLVD